jgi:hypothetical protein
VLDRFPDQTRTQTASAHTDPFVTLADHRANRLDVRVEHTPGFIVGVADIIP